MILKRLSIILLLIFSSTSFVFGEEVNNNEHQINFFTGNFDFSDDKQKAILVGFQHQNENLNRDTFLETYLQLQVVLLRKILLHIFILE